MTDAAIRQALYRGEMTSEKAMAEIKATLLEIEEAVGKYAHELATSDKHFNDAHLFTEDELFHLSGCWKESWGDPYRTFKAGEEQAKFEAFEKCAQFTEFNYSKGYSIKKLLALRMEIERPKEDPKEIFESIPGEDKPEGIQDVGGATISKAAWSAGLREAIEKGEMTPERALINAEYFSEVIDTAVENALRWTSDDEDENGEYESEYVYYMRGIPARYVWEHPEKREQLKDFATIIKRTPYTFDEAMNLQRLIHDLEKQVNRNNGDTYKHPTEPELVSYQTEKSEHIEEKKQENQKSQSTEKIVWKWYKADLAWLYSVLREKRAIDCSITSFASLFVDEDLKPMPPNLMDYQKGRDPKRQGMQDLRSAIMKHNPEDTLT